MKEAHYDYLFVPYSLCLYSVNRIYAHAPQTKRNMNILQQIIYFFLIKHISQIIALLKLQKSDIWKQFKSQLEILDRRTRKNLTSNSGENEKQRFAQGDEPANSKKI